MSEGGRPRSDASRSRDSGDEQSGSISVGGPSSVSRPSSDDSRNVSADIVQNPEMDDLGYPDPEADVLDDLTDPDLYLETDPIYNTENLLNQYSDSVVASVTEG